jgi:hypothetical protein
VIYWHVAIITLYLSDGGTLAVTIPFPDAETCGAALPALVEGVRAGHEADGFCKPTDLPSGVSVRPQARP